MKYALLHPLTYKERIPELRERYMSIYGEGKLSHPQCAKRMNIALDTLRNFIRGDHISNYKTCRIIEKWVMSQEEKKG